MPKFKSKPIINHDEKPIEDNGRVRDVEDFYNHQEFQKPPITQSRTAVLSLVLAVFFGFASGLLSLLLFLSGTLSNSKLFSFLDINSLLPAANVIIKHQEETTVLEDERIAAVAEEVFPSVIGFFNYKAPSSDPQKSSYGRADFLGSGLILTNDGWLVTTNEVIKTEGKYVAVTQNHEVYEVKQMEKDGNLGLIFLKVEGKNFPVAALAHLKDIYDGERMLALSGLDYFNKNLMVGRLANRNFLLNDKLVHESENYYLFFILNPVLEQKFAGASVFNLNKEAVGLNASYENTNYVIPIDYLKKSFEQILTKHKIERLYLGVEYIDLSAAINPNLEQTGALITEIKNDSPLKKLDVAAGDIILKVEEDVINGNKNLTNLIQTYETGDKVKLTVWDKSEKREMVVEVILVYPEEPR